MGPIRQAIEGGVEPSGRSEAETELARERERRAELERRLERMTAESDRRQRERENADRLARLRNGLERRGVSKPELAVRLLKEDVRRSPDGNLYGEVAGEAVPLDDFLERFVTENPEFLPPRIAGGAGVTQRDERGLSASGLDMESIRPGMSPEETRHAWDEVARLMGHRKS